MRIMDLRSDVHARMHSVIDPDTDVNCRLITFVYNITQISKFDYPPFKFFLFAIFNG